MWSLPDIVSMNAHAKTSRKKFERAVETGKIDRKVIRCEHCNKKATSVELFYDIFSPDPKGVASFCDEHLDWKHESYFECDDCGNTFVNNYTWEMYSVNTERGTLCLPCYAKQILADPKEWINLTDKEIDAVDFDKISKAKHLIGVKMPIPEGIKFVDNVEFDSMSGQSISGGGVPELKNQLHTLKDQGAKRAILILDGAYQFAVSIGIYIDDKKGAKK